MVLLGPSTPRGHLPVTPIPPEEHGIEEPVPHPPGGPRGGPAQRKSAKNGRKRRYFGNFSRTIDWIAVIWLNEEHMVVLDALCLLKRLNCAQN